MGYGNGFVVKNILILSVFFIRSCLQLLPKNDYFFPHFIYLFIYFFFDISRLMVFRVSLLGCYGCSYLFFALFVLSASDAVTGLQAFPVLP